MELSVAIGIGGYIDSQPSVYAEPVNQELTVLFIFAVHQ